MNQIGLIYESLSNHQAITGSLGSTIPDATIADISVSTRRARVISVAVTARWMKWQYLIRCGWYNDPISVRDGLQYNPN